LNEINDLNARRSPQADKVRTGNIKDIQLPLSTNSWATLSAEFPLTQSGWTQLLAVLNAMKPALVKPEDNNE